MGKKLEGKRAVVTGAGSGMGRAIAQRFAAEGATIAALDLKRESAEETMSTIDGGLAIEIDVSDPASVETAAQTALEALGGVDILVNNAGILDDYAPLLDTSEELWHQILSVNLTGPFLVTRRLLPSMLEAGGGAVVNTASIAGLVAKAGGTAYTASKHGLIGFTRQLSADYGPQGIRANAICPGAVETGMTRKILDDEDAAVMDSIRSVPAGRHAQPEEIANLALFLASDDSAFVHGAAYVIDGGWTIV